ncbi:MAG: Wzz/FepE/Etk N-terminal domain-containing protein [Methyloceanibacter sp.]
MSRSRENPPLTEDVDLPTLGHALWRAKGWILWLTIAAGIITFVVLCMMRPLYTSEARILIQNDESSFTRPTGEQILERQSTLDEQAVQSQVQVLTSRDLILQVVRDLDLTNNTEFAKDAGVTYFRRLLNQIELGRGTPESEDEKATNALARNLSVFQLSKSSVISIEYSSGDPKLAAQIANKLADVYIGWQRTAKIEQTKDATAWPRDQIDVLRKRVAESEEAAERFRASKGLYSGTNNVSLNAQQLSELNSQLILAALNSQLILVVAQKSEADACARLLKKMLADNGDIDATPEVMKSAPIIKLIEQRVLVQRQLAELSATLLPSHPRIQQLGSELADVRQQIRVEAQKIVKSLENEAAVANAREASLRVSLNDAKSKTSGLGDSELKLRALEREAKSNRDLLESYLARYRDASARHDMGAVLARATIVSRAHASVLPSFPKRGASTRLVMVATMLLALAYVIARELMSGTPQAHQVREFREPRMRHRRPRHAPSPASPPLRSSATAEHAKPVPPAPPAAAAPVAAPPPVVKSPAASSACAAASPAKTSASNLPAVIPIPPPSRAEPPKEAPKQAAPKAAATAAKWPVKDTPIRPSWLQVDEPRRPPKAPPPPPEPEKAPHTETPAPSPATRLVERLCQELSPEVGETQDSTPNRGMKMAAGLFDRFRRRHSPDESEAEPAKPTALDEDMSALRPNDLRHYLAQRIATAGTPDDHETSVAKRPISNVGPTLKSLDAVLNHVLASTKGGPPGALFVAGVSPKADATQAAIGIARVLVEKLEQVVLLDLTRGTSAVSGPLELPRAPGFTDLAAGRASFGEVIRIDGETPLQVITAGHPSIKEYGHEPDSFMRVFEALTQTYDRVVLHADLDTVRLLISSLKLELPSMVAVLPPGSGSESARDALSTFASLGCPVVVYEQDGKRRRAGLFARAAAI